MVGFWWRILNAFGWSLGTIGYSPNCKACYLDSISIKSCTELHQRKWFTVNHTTFCLINYFTLCHFYVLIVEHHCSTRQPWTICMNMILYLISLIFFLTNSHINLELNHIYICLYFFFSDLGLELYTKWSSVFINFMCSLWNIFVLPASHE